VSEEIPSVGGDVHDRAMAQFSDYLDATLGADERKQVDQHLEGCAPCRAELEALRTTLQAMRGAARPEAPPEFMDELREQIRTRSRGRFFAGKRRSYRLEIASLVTLVIALVIYIVLQMVQPLLLVH
jgi:anti-sigma factor RsiW